MRGTSINRSSRLAIAALAGAGAMAVLLGTASTPAAGAEIDWAAAADGDFNTGTSWTGGNVPTSGDNATFDQAGTYTASFSDDITTAGATIRQGDVSWNLGTKTYTINSPGLVLAGGDGATGSLTVSGGTIAPSTTLSVSGTNQSFTLNASGATVTNPSGNALWYIGNSGTGTLNFDNGSKGHAQNFYVGRGNNGNGTAIIDGPTTELTVDGTGFYVSYTGSTGQEAVGHLTVSNGATIHYTGTAYAGQGAGASTGNTINVLSGAHFNAGYFRLASNNAASGADMIVSGAGSSVTATGNSRSYVGDKGTASLTIKDGGSWTQQDTSANTWIRQIQVNKAGTLNLGGSTIVADLLSSTAGLTTGPGAKFDISHSNSIAGNVDLTNALSTTVHISSASDWGKLVIAAGTQAAPTEPTHGGNLALGGVLDVVFDSYTPVGGESFDLFDWTGTLSGTFSSVDLPTLPGQLTWDSTQLYNTGVISISGVPEPTALGLLAVGGLLAMRRRRSA